MDCAVIGMPDEEAGELPLAFIVPNAKYNPTKRELQDFVAGNYYGILLNKTKK